MKYRYLLAKISFLQGHLNPDWFDGHPGQPGPLPDAAVDLFLAGVVRGLAAQTHVRDTGAHLHDLGARFAASALATLGSSVSTEPGDDLCPPYWPHHGPIRFGDLVSINPQPLPPGPDPYDAPGASRDVLIAFALRRIAGLTTSESFSKEIFAAGQAIIRASAQRAVDDYCGTPVPHRIPVPHHG